MDSKGFFLGLIAAVVLFLLWKKETIPASLPSFLQPPAQAPQPSGGCSGCGGSPGGPSGAAAPTEQAPLAMIAGTGGQISPGTPPLQGSLGVGSFYNATGPTPDNTFLSTPLTPKQVINTSVGKSQIVYANVPGSASTPANQVPVRAVQPVAPTSQLGFQQRYNYAGIPRTAGARLLVN